MCTLALYFRQFKEFPLIVAANRDESYARPSQPPQILSRNPLVAAGKDLLAGGTWLGWNEHGLVAGVLNRKSAETAPHAVRSRGLLCLEVLSAADTLQAREILEAQNGLDYNPFNLVFADAERAGVARNDGPKIGCRELAEGLHVFGNDDVLDLRRAKANSAHLLFSKIPEELPRTPGLFSWANALHRALESHDLQPNCADAGSAICVHTPGRGTVSSTLVFLDRGASRFCSYHAPGPPCRTAHEPSIPLELR